MTPVRVLPGRGSRRAELTGVQNFHFLSCHATQPPDDGGCHGYSGIRVRTVAANHRHVGAVYKVKTESWMQKHLIMLSRRKRERERQRERERARESERASERVSERGRERGRARSRAMQSDMPSSNQHPALTKASEH